MTTTWCFSSEDESNAKMRQYNLSLYLHGNRLIGLKARDDFIVRSPTGELFSVPTVPLVEECLQAYCFPSPLVLHTDERFLGRLKWYTKLLIFGGDSNAGDNLTWVSYEQHAQLVKWWKNQYQAMQATPGA